MQTQPPAVPPLFHPLVADWFRQQFGAATECQAQAWAALGDGSDVLISAPTGSGKTLAAFLLCLDRLVRAGVSGQLDDRIQVVYVSPLKALSNDVQKNLERRWPRSRRWPPSAASRSRRSAPRFAPATRRLRSGSRCHASAAHSGHHARIAVHPADRRAEPRAMLASARTVIVDEIHAVADDKRGSHLALTLARLDDLVRRQAGRSPQRIGLSATVRPIEEVARFLSRRAACASSTSATGARWISRSKCRSDELGAVASNEMWGEIYDRLAALIREHRTTLVFVNTRRLAERVAHHLGERLGEDAVLRAPRQPVARLRLDAEHRLKRGELRAVVATASLELGIDIGTVDLVCQIGSPRSIAVALQRIGRSGHWVDASAEGPPLRHHARRADRVRRAGARDPLRRARPPGDSRAGRSTSWRSRSSPPRPATTGAKTTCSRSSAAPIPIATSRARISTRSSRCSRKASHRARPRRGAYLHRDQVNRMRARAARRAPGRHHLRRRHSRQRAITWWSPSPKAPVVGTLDEDFAVESMAGDVFLLGTTSWRIRRVEAGRVRVEDAHGARALDSVLARRSARPHAGAVATKFRALREEIVRRERQTPSTLLMARVRPRPRAAPSRPPRTCAPARRLSARCPRTHRRRRALLRRSRRHAAGPPRPVRRAHQPRLGPGAAQALLPLVQLRAAGGRHRQRHRHLARRAAQLSAGDRVSSSCAPQTVEEVLTQAMLAAPMFTARWRWNAIAGAGRPALLAAAARCRRRFSACASDDLLAAVFPDQAACAGEPVGRDPHPRPSAGERDHPRLPARGDGPRRAEARPRRHSERRRSGRAPSIRPSRRRSRTRS